MTLTSPPDKPGIELSTRVIATVVVAVVVGALGCSSVGGSTPNGPRLLVAAAAMSSGALIGFLFGVPRMASRPEASATQSGNTNLEQVSDWLTKILLGAGLVQLGAARQGMAALFANVSPLFGSGVGASATGAAALIYFAALGFLSGWLFTRVFLGRTLAETDRWIRAAETLADEAEKRGDNDQAAALRGLRDGKTDPSTIWDTIRSSMEPGIVRTQLQDQNFEATLNASEQSMAATDVANLFSGGTPGARMAALRVMAQRPDTACLPCVIDAIEQSRSGNEQFQALRVSQSIAGSLGAEEKLTLRGVIDEAQRPGRWIAADSSRREVAQAVRALLE